MEKSSKKQPLASNPQRGAGILEAIVGGAVLVVVASFGYRSLNNDLSMLALSGARMEVYTNVSPLARGVEGALFDASQQARACPEASTFSVAALRDYLGRNVYLSSQFNQEYPDHRLEHYQQVICQNSDLCAMAPASQRSGSDAHLRGDILIGLEFGRYDFATLGFIRCMGTRIQIESQVPAVRYQLVQLMGSGRPIQRQGIIKDPSGVRSGGFTPAAITIPGPPNFDGVVTARALFIRFPASFPSIGERRNSYRILQGGVTYTTSTDISGNTTTHSSPGFRIAVPYNCSTSDPKEVPEISDCAPCYSLASTGWGPGSEPVTAEELMETDDLPENLKNFECGTFEHIQYTGSHMERL